MKLKVGKRTFDIEIKDKIDEDDDWGKVIYGDKLIQVKNVNEIENRTTLLHEILHVILKSIGQNDHDENMIDGIAERLYEVLLDNPEIVKYILKKI